MNLSFVDVFFENRLIYIFLVLVSFFFSKWYARALVKRIMAGKLQIKKIGLQTIWLFMTFSVCLFLIVMIFL